MSRFFVGQRVRIVRDVWGDTPELTGTESCIVAIWHHDPFRDGFIVRLACIDCASFHPSELEPILPDGHRACDDEFKHDLDKLLEGVPA